MKFSCKKQDLNKYIDVLANVAPNNTTLPIIQNSLFEVKNSILSLVSTNIDFGIKYSIPVKIEEDFKNDIKFAIPIKIFAKIVKNIKNQDLINFEINDNVLNIKTNQESVNLLMKNADEFPDLPKYEENNKFDIDPNIFIQGFKSTMFASALTSVKPELSSVYVYKDKKNLVFVSTDQFRLAEKKIKTDIKEDFSLIIPITNISYINNILSKIENKIEVFFDENQIIIKSNNIQIYSRIVDGSYPDYKAIIPKEYKTRFNILKSDLSDMLSNLSIFSDKYGKIIFFVKNRKLTIYTKNEQIGEIEYNPDVNIEGEDIELSFNYKYIQDTLQSINTDMVTFEFAGDNAPLVIKPTGDYSYIYLVMPMVS